MKKEDFLKKLDKKRSDLASKLLDKASTEEKVSLWNDFCKSNYCEKYMIYEYNIDFINKISYKQYKESDYVFIDKYATIIGYEEGYKTFDYLSELDSPYNGDVLHKWLTDNYLYHYDPNPEDYY